MQGIPSHKPVSNLVLFHARQPPTLWSPLAADGMFRQSVSLTTMSIFLHVQLLACTAQEETGRVVVISLR